jgi:hypothetical protein
VEFWGFLLELITYFVWILAQLLYGICPPENGVCFFYLHIFGLFHLSNFHNFVTKFSQKLSFFICTYCALFICKIIFTILSQNSQGDNLTHKHKNVGNYGWGIRPQVYW